MRTQKKHLLKVLIIDPACFVLYYNLCYCEAVAKLGVNIEILTSYFKYDYIEPPLNVKIKYSFFKLGAILDRFFDSKRLRRIYRMIEYPFNLINLVIYSKSRKFDVIHFSWSILPWLDYWVMWVLKKMGFKIVYTAHNAFPHEMKAAHIKQYCKIYHLADKLIVLTKYVENEIKKYCKLDESKISLIPHGNYHYIVKQFETENYFNKNGEFVIGFIGLIRPYKGLDYLLKAFSIIHQKIPHSKLLIVGKSLEKFDKYRRLIKSLNIENDVSTEIRYIPMKDLIPLIKRMDVVVFPNITASQSGSIAMLYDLEIPVVVTDVGGLPEMVSEGESGFVVPAKDENGLAEIVVSMLSDVNKLRQLKKSTRHFGQNNFSWEILAPKAVAVYRELLN